MIRWLQKLTVTEGPRAGEPLTLLPFQRRFIYGVMRNHESALTIARGNGKTTLTAAPRAQTVVVAASLGRRASRSATRSGCCDRSSRRTNGAGG